MDYGTPELLVRFLAKDRNGSKYVLTQYAISTQSDASNPNQADDLRRKRSLYILTEDRQLVARIAKGHYEICNMAGTQLFSDAPDAP